MEGDYGNAKVLVGEQSTRNGDGKEGRRRLEESKTIAMIILHKQSSVLFFIFLSLYPSSSIKKFFLALILQGIFEESVFFVCLQLLNMVEKSSARRAKKKKRILWTESLKTYIQLNRNFLKA